ncbi:hypothetical protein SAMN05216466_113236 [Paraburkholderia phenazinium]|uniref:Uncharacterized protein n=1 Tax=Paraburkholderia phenazinium TaxID=60549 RepID=A0A1G8FLI3_9BURK|nr:hypothetical protein SAMN05216466_113236 [Paraburkholderia phenazinium]
MPDDNIRVATDLLIMRSVIRSRTKHPNQFSGESVLAVRASHVRVFFDFRKTLIDIYIQNPNKVLVRPNQKSIGKKRPFGLRLSEALKLFQRHSP